MIIPLWIPICTSRKDCGWLYRTTNSSLRPVANIYWFRHMLLHGMILVQHCLQLSQLCLGFWQMPENNKHWFHGNFSMTTWKAWQRYSGFLWGRWWRESCISRTICKQSPLGSKEITMLTPNYIIFTSRMLFLTPNQQCQSTEGNDRCLKMCCLTSIYSHYIIVIVNNRTTLQLSTLSLLFSHKCLSQYSKEYLYIGWQWSNFVPYLCQLVSDAILWVKLIEMFVTLMTLKYALSAGWWSCGHFPQLTG